MQITNSHNSTERHLWHSLKCQTSVCWMAFTRVELPQFCFCIWQCDRQKTICFYMHVCRCTSPALCMYFSFIPYSLNDPQVSPVLNILLQSLSMLSYCISKLPFLHIKVSASLEKDNGYHLHGYPKEYIHNELKHRSTGQILLIHLQKWCKILQRFQTHSKKTCLSSHHLMLQKHLSNIKINRARL